MGERAFTTPPDVRRPERIGQKHSEVLSAPRVVGCVSEPDEIEQEIRLRGFLDFAAYGVKTTASEALSFFRNSSLLVTAKMADSVARLEFANGRLGFGTIEVNSYFASAASDFLRQKLLELKVSFTFETVMSHSGKVEFLGNAQQVGYRTYLYFIATDDPAINISRVRNRVKLGGHSVPEDRIETRYHRSLDLLMEAIRHSNRAYVFDNSGENMNRKHTWLAEITDGNLLELKSDQIPAWFKRAVLDKIMPQV